MTCFSSVKTAAVAEPDPAKHVNYNLGMVLGVDDFTQEFAYLSERDQWMACMKQAMNETGLDSTLAERLAASFFNTADWMRNRGG